MRELAAAAVRGRETCRLPAWSTARRLRSVSAGSVAETVEVEVVAVCEGRAGRAVSSGLDPDAVADTTRAAGRAAEAAARTQGPGQVSGPVSPGPTRTHGGFDPVTARAAPEDLRGGVHVRAAWTALAVTGDDDPVEDAWTEAEACAAQEGGRATGAAVALDALPLEALAALARWRGGGSDQAHSPPERGELPAVLGPEALGALLAALGAVAFDGRRHAEGTGALVGRLGTRVAAAAVNLADSPRFAQTLPRARDAEGTLKAPLPLIQDGVAHRVVHDGTSAALAGTTSTGHALAPGGVAGGPRPRNLVLVGGGVAGEPELVAELAEGIHVPALGPVEILDPGGALVSAPILGARAIRDGRLGAPVAGLCVRDSALEILARVAALSARPRLVGLGPRGVVTPAARLSGIMVA